MKQIIGSMRLEYSGIGSFMQLLQVSTTCGFGCLTKLEPDATYALRLCEELTGQIENICRLSLCGSDMFKGLFLIEFPFQIAVCVCFYNLRWFYLVIKLICF